MHYNTTTHVLTTMLAFMAADCEASASQIDDGESGMSLGDSESEYIYVDQYGNPVGGGARMRSRPPPGQVNNTAFYELMGLQVNCTEDEIKKAYKRKALKWHPDKNPENKTFAESMFKKVSDAYQVLSDPQKRALYDKYGEQALSGEGGVAEESEEGGAAGFSGFRSADDLFQTFFGVGGGASVFEVDTEGSGGGVGNIFSFVVGGEDGDDDEGEEEIDDEEWEDVAGSEARKGHGRRGGRKGGWRGARTYQGSRGGWQGRGRVGAGSGSLRGGRGSQRGNGNRGGRGGGNWGWGRSRGGKKVPDSSFPKGSPTRVGV
jgi:hypothetical protein